MKKLFCVLAAVLLFIFGLAACTDKTPAGGTRQDETDTDGQSSIILGDETEESMQIYFDVGDTRLTATLEDNSATAELKKKLKTAPVSIDMADYGGFEKVGDFGFSLPTSDIQIKTQPCDFVLYQGNKLVIFYQSNTWSYTRLGKITGVTPAELKTVLGNGDVTVTLSAASA